MATLTGSLPSAVVTFADVKPVTLMATLTGSLPSAVVTLAEVSPVTRLATLANPTLRLAAYPLRAVKSKTELFTFVVIADIRYG